MKYLFFIGLTCFTFSLPGQTILFKETFKNNAYYDGPASSYALYDNSSSMYSDDYVRIANSSTVSNYPGASGKILYEEWLKDKLQQVEFDHNKGFYILKVYSPQKCYTFKVLII